jgi:hypothetical protein
MADLSEFFSEFTPSNSRSISFAPPEIADEDQKEFDNANEPNRQNWHDSDWQSTLYPPMTSLSTGPTTSFFSETPPSSPRPILSQDLSTKVLSDTDSLPMPIPRMDSTSEGKGFRFESSVFNLRRLPRNTAIAVMGGIRSGKSKLITWMLQVMQYQRVVAFLGGSDSSAWYRFFIPDCFIHDCALRPFQENAVTQIIDHQNRLLSFKSHLVEFYGLNIELCILFEDLSFGRLFRHSETITQLVSNTRRLDITTIFSAQYSNSFGTKIRANFEFSFLFRIEGTKEQTFCYEMFNGGAFPNFDSFSKAWMDITKEKHACMVMCRGCPEISERVCRLKAPPPPDEKNPEEMKKQAYVVGLNSIIFHHIFRKRQSVNPDIQLYERIFRGQSKDPPGPLETVHNMGRKGVLIHRALPSDPGLNQIVKVPESVVPASLFGGQTSKPLEGSIPYPPAPIDTSYPLPLSSEWAI